MTAAILAAQRGYRVLLLERRTTLGGMSAAESFYPGFSCGLRQETLGFPAVLIARLGLDIERDSLLKDPDRVLRIASSTGSLNLQLGRGNGAISDDQRSCEARAFFAFIAQAEAPLGRAMSFPPADPVTGELDRLPLARLVWSMRRLGARGLLELLRVPPMSASDWLDEWFEDDRIKLGLMLPALTGGFSAPRSPGTAMLVLLREVALRLGVAVSPAMLVRAMSARLETLQVDVRCDSELETVEMDNRGVSGVVAGGIAFKGRRVIVTCDPKQLFTARLPRELLSDALRHHFVHYRCRGTMAWMRMAVDGEVKQEGGRIPTGGLIVGDNPMQLERAFDPVKYGELPARPVLHVFVPSDGETWLAPRGKSVISVQIAHAPYAAPDTEQLQRWMEAILARLRGAIPSLESTMLHVELDLPQDLERRYGCSGGHIQHGETGLDQLLVRPAPGCTRYATPVPGLYLGGRGSHPGPFGDGLPGSQAVDRALRETGRG